MPHVCLHGRRTLVLGASGFLGRRLVKALADAGARVVAQVRAPSRAPTDDAVETLSLDLAVPGSGAEAVRLAAPELVFLASGYGVAKDERAAEGFERINAELPVEVADALAASPGEPRLLHVGSALEYGSAADSLDEAAPCRPDTAYGRSKLAATIALDDRRRRGLWAVTLRAFTLFGPGEREGRLVPTLLRAFRDREAVSLSNGTQERDWVFVDDAVRALLELAGSDSPAVLEHRYPFDAPAINLASGRIVSVRRFVETFADAFAIPGERLRFGDLPELPEEMHHPPVPVDRLRTALGWTPPPDPRAGIERLRPLLPPLPRPERSLE